MKFTVHRRSKGHVDIIGQVGIDSEKPSSHRAIDVRVEVGDLTHRVNAGVRPAGTDYLDVFVGHRCDRFFQPLLYADTRILPLPAYVFSTVILNA